MKKTTFCVIALCCLMMASWLIAPSAAHAATISATQSQQLNHSAIPNDLVNCNSSTFQFWTTGGSHDCFALNNPNSNGHAQVQPVGNLSGVNKMQSGPYYGVLRCTDPVNHTCDSNNGFVSFGPQFSPSTFSPVTIVYLCISDAPGLC